MAKSEWQKHLMATYKKLKSKNKDAMLSDAMKIAGKTYKKKAVKGGTKLHPLTPKELSEPVHMESEEEEVDTETEEKPVMDGGKKKRKTAKRKTSKKAKKSKRKTGKKK